MENNRISHNKNKTHTILLARVKKNKKKRDTLGHFGLEEKTI